MKGGHIKVVEFLIKQGANDNLPNTEGLTAMHYALLKGQRFCSGDAVKVFGKRVISSN